LEVAVRNGSFREDLYYRLAVLPINVPALREKGDDVLLLATHFLHVFAHEGSRSITGFSDAALAVITRAPWPGNVRELINRVRRALVVADARWISPADLGFECHKGISPARKTAETRTVLAALRSTLERNGQNMSRAARDLGISRTTAYRLPSRCGETR
jgi:DNA-binding NtrC family response regulator